MKDKLDMLLYFLKKTWFVILVVVILVIGGVSGVEIYREEVLNIDPDVEYKTSKTLSLSCEPLDTLNPVLSRSEDIYHLSKLIYNSLFEYDDTLNVKPELVESYTVDKNRGKVTLKLKEGIKWHNGEKLTARDINYTVTAFNAAGNKSLYYDLTSKISYVYVRGTYEAEIYFKNAYNASLDDLTFPILPSSQYSTAYQLAKDADHFKPVGTGQYQYQSYNYLKQLRLKPFEDYWDTPASTKLKVMILPDKELSSNMMEIESVTCYVDTSSDRKSTVIDKNFVMYDMISNEVEFLIFNHKSEYMKQANMRKAIATAINEEEVLSNGYMNDAVLSDTIYFPGFCGVKEEGTPYSYSPEKAAQLLEKMGYKDRNNDGILESEEEKILEISVAVNKKNATRLAAARVIQKNLENIGIRVKLDELTWDDYQRAISAGKHDIIVTGFAVNEQYDLREFFNRKNAWGYYNDQLLTLANELEQLHTAEEYQQVYAELKMALMKELPYYSLCYKKIGLVGVNGFSAEKPPVFNDYYRNIETWSWTYQVIQENAENNSEMKAEEGSDISASDKE